MNGSLVLSAKVEKESQKVPTIPSRDSTFVSLPKWYLYVNSILFMGASNENPNPCHSLDICDNV